MDPSSDLPSSLQPPFDGDRVIFTWRVEIGAEARVRGLIQQLEDLETAVDLGERVGAKLARASARRQLLNRMAREGPGALEEIARGSGYRSRDLRYLEEWVDTYGWSPSPSRRYAVPELGDLLQTLADFRVPDLLGSSTALRRVEYRNPLEVVLTGSGFLIGGVIYVLRFVRDWSSKRRADSAVADQAQARAVRERAGARLVEWLTEEATAGRWHVPPGELLESVTRAESGALERMSEADVTLELPPALDPGPHSRDRPGP